jgi:hypothetical protein
MDMTTVLAWLEVVSLLAVLVTLVYLARQVHQENVLLRSEARQAQVSTDQTHIYQFIEHPDLARTFAGKLAVTEEEKTRMNFWIIASLRAREFEWIQYKAGALDEEDWLAYRNVIYFTLGTERARQYWNACKQFFNPSFSEHVDGMLEDAPFNDYWESIEHIA